MTNFDPQKHHRRSIRLPGYDYTQAGAYYITIVTHNRKNLFGAVINHEMCLSPLGKIAFHEWEQLARRFKQVELGAFVVMPNHVHGIIIIHEDRATADLTAQHNPPDLRRAPTHERFGKPVSGSIPTIVRSYKSAVTLRINYARRSDNDPVWQRNYYEHVIRDERDMQAKWDYIEGNPILWDDDDENSNNR
jgi:putative transposase